MPPSARLLQAAQTVGMFGVALGAATIMGFLVLQTGFGQMSENDAWRSIAGPPCKTVAEPSAAWRGGAHPVRSFAFEGQRFWRKYGDVECTVTNPGRVVTCQFLSPGLVGLERADGIAWFAPPIGRPATVRAKAEGPACVVGGWLSRLPPR